MYRLSAILAALASAWLLISWMDVASPGIADLKVAKIQTGSLEAPTFEAIGTAQLTEVQVPFRFISPFGVARLHFNVGNPETADLALFVRRVRDNYAVFINGKLAQPIVGTLSPQPTLDGVQPRLIRFLPALLIPGTNVIDIVCARNTSPPLLREIYLGPAHRLEPAYRHSVTILKESAEIGAFAAAMVLLFALAITPLIKNRALTITIALTLAFFLGRELHILWINVAWSQALRDAFFMLIASGVWLSCAAFVNEWTQGPTVLRKVFLAAGILTAGFIVLCYSTMQVLDASATTAVMESIVELTTFPFMAYRLFHHYRAAPSTAWGEIFAATVCLAMAVASIVTQTEVLPGLSEFVSVQGEAFVQYGALSIIAFIALGLARHSVSIHQLAAMNNQTLALRVAEKQRELEAQHALLRSQESERMLVAERGRIMSDVHDGIGSQLLGLLLQARSGRTSLDQLVDGLQSALDDLYLVVDSLDTVEGSLETVLGTYRARIAPKCESAGVTLNWQVDEGARAEVTTPTAILQLCRILQEGISNAIRHGRATQISFRLTSLGGKSVLSLTDNGKGFDPDAVVGAGRGLTNMRKRAAAIGATLNIVSGKAGSRVQITLPA